MRSWRCCSGWLAMDDHCRDCGMHGPDTSRVRVSPHRNGHRPSYGPEDHAAAQRALDEGCGLRLAAQAAGCSKDAVRDWLRRGLVTRREDD